MVLFDNINVNQRVEVRYLGGIHPGSVKYKGILNGRDGEWVGIALDAAIGKHDGMINGRRYFQCYPDHGIFTISSNIRFLSTKRHLFNKYRTISRCSETETELFTSSPKIPNRFGNVSENYADSAKETFASSLPIRSSACNLGNPTFRNENLNKTFPLKRAISRTIPPAMSTRNVQTARSIVASYRTNPINDQFDYEENQFITTPSIPKSHMPYEALVDQVHRGWSPRDHFVRELSVSTARDSINFGSNLVLNPATVI